MISVTVPAPAAFDPSMSIEPLKRHPSSRETLGAAMLPDTAPVRVTMDLPPCRRRSPSTVPLDPNALRLDGSADLTVLADRHEMVLQRDGTFDPAVDEQVLVAGQVTVLCGSTIRPPHSRSCVMRLPEQVRLRGSGLSRTLSVGTLGFEGVTSLVEHFGSP